MKDTCTITKFSTYLKERFNAKVYKVSVDAGFSCPNRDGTIGREGCSYCDNKTFSFLKRSGDQPSLDDQIAQGIEAVKKKFKAEKFIIYFQPHTNTYAPLDKLKETYDVVRKFKDIVGISIATRPDCIDEKILSLIDTYAGDYEVWIEYGLQSIYNETLLAINRGHTYEDFLKALELTRRYRVKVCAHIIIGLPGETEEMILNTAKAMADLKIEGIKIHPLHVVKGTPLATLFKNGGCRAFSFSEYLDLLTKFLDLLWPKTVVQRISAYCPPNLLIAPDWISHKNILEHHLRY